MLLLFNSASGVKNTFVMLGTHKTKMMCKFYVNKSTIQTCNVPNLIKPYKLNIILHTVHTFNTLILLLTDTW